MSETALLETDAEGRLIGFTATGRQARLGWLNDPDLQCLMAAFEDAGHRILAVGGCVRNAVLGMGATDIDLSTDATPPVATEIAGSLGHRVVPTGVDHGTITVVLPGAAYEITTFRKDVETDGRRAVVAFSTEVADDAARRDFTMNALYLDRQGRILDPVRGCSDLLARRVRFIGDAEARIREDYLRILRFFRFHAQVGNPEDGIEPEGLAACASLAEGLGRISNERIGVEMRKLLEGANAAIPLSSMAQTGILSRILPGASAEVFVRLDAMDPPLPRPNLTARLAALGGEEMSDRLRLSREESRQVETLRRAAMSDDGPEVLGFRLGADLGAQALLLRWAMLAETARPAALERVSFGAAQVFPVRAADLMPGLQGAALGTHLKTLEGRWIESGFQMSREELLRE